MSGSRCRSRPAIGLMRTRWCGRWSARGTASRLCDASADAPVRWPDHRREGTRVSDNLRLLGKYSDAMASGADDAVYEFFSPDFHSHVSERINPEVIGTDIRGSEQ